MGPGWIIVAVVGVVGVLLVMFGAGIYNRLVSLQNRYENAFSQIEVQLQRRYDLIPNLVEAVKGYMKHERETLEAVITARNQAAGSLKAAAAHPGAAGAMADLASAEKGLGAVLGRLFAVAEDYPDLKANQNMMQMTEELTSTENKVGFARQAFNDSATEYNTYRETFPAIVFAGMLGHGTNAQLLQFDSAAIADAPKVSFN